jgi:hypothetical protein
MSGAATQHAGKGTVVVTTSAELLAALTAENAGRRILVRAGAYAITQPLIVPDGAMLEGEGVMQFDGAGLPVGFATGTRTTLTMTANVPGDMLTLGDGVTIRGLEIADLPGRAGGNVVAVVSREAGDRVSTAIIESEIVNPNAALGQAGNGLLILTRNLNLGADPAPHAGAVLTVSMVRSLIRSPAGGGGLFAFNNAAGGRVSVTLAGNVVGGGINANGGVSLPDAVHDAETRIESRRNLYRDESSDPCAVARSGWNLTGGSGPPFPLSVPETARNTLRMHSSDDRIERFRIGILATGARRFFPLPTAGPSTDNSVDLSLLGATISTPSCAGAPAVDFRLAGALVTNASVAPGDGNTLRAVIRGVTGSAPRANAYADVLGPAGPQPAQLHGIANKLAINGNQQSFMQTNAGIDPLPGAEFFTGGR